ncbi:hypothetical protein CXF43_07760 [Corynebacterium bovis]|uniref:hypothetical protein n=1 Tax=Corynebacterium bovis TaxID=36808 RepID=UPI000F649526|nr:hypothetical protein [Corynebacterium bovis]RRQ06619.1 hypothetical protein CXF43_07760 [Corynebacterium bovis]
MGGVDPPSHRWASQPRRAATVSAASSDPKYTTAAGSKPARATCRSNRRNAPWCGVVKRSSTENDVTAAARPQSAARTRSTTGCGASARTAYGRPVARRCMSRRSVAGSGVEHRAVSSAMRSSTSAGSGSTPAERRTAVAKSRGPIDRQ